MFGKQLARAVPRFGKQLIRGVSTIGKQIGRGANAVENALAKAGEKVSNIEKYTNKIPIVGSAVKTIEGGLKTGSSLSGASSSLLKGRPQEALAKGVNAVNQGRDTLATGASTLAQGAMFL